ncbi:MAG TPA: class I SAM-dependent methyltransferase [Bradyrhizobium sp.]|jgi:cyclopropane-fatty-acyl-phospholipid synthase
MANSGANEYSLGKAAAPVPNLGASKASIQAHYDREPRLYERFLGPSLAYSAGIWNEPANRDTLEAAQLRKLDWHIDMSGADTGQRVLEVGFGWGSLIKQLMVRRPGLDYVGLTLADNQAQYVRSYAPENFATEISAWQDYQSNRPFDAIVSLEAMEHFAGKAVDREGRIEAYRLFFEFCARMLRVGGRASIQVNGWGNIAPGSEARHIADSGIDGFWLEGNLPHGSEMLLASEPWFNLVHLEGKPRDYIYTLRSWIRNLRRNEADLVALVGPEMVKDYLHNFTVCLDAYLAGALTLYRLVLERKGPVVA